MAGAPGNGRPCCGHHRRAVLDPIAAVAIRSTNEARRPVIRAQEHVLPDWEGAQLGAGVAAHEVELAAPVTTATPPREEP